jgi:hypothetical protein
MSAQKTTAAGQREIDWASARSEDGSVSVDLSGEAPKGWNKHFEGVLALLDHGSGRWGAIKLAKGAIKVADVREGAEEDLRHLLESTLLQVNSDLGPAEEEAASPSAEAPGQEDPAATADERMTERFRAFAHAEAGEAGAAAE